MMAISFQAPTLSADESLKNTAATQQMVDLMELISDGRRHATLSIADRAMLLKKGFAKDLVDNVIFYTERASDAVRHSHDDQLVVGFTHSAFDPSLYACDSIMDSLRVSHDGRCAYCESSVDHASLARVSHYRPPWGAFSHGQWQRNSYFEFAYEPKNLLYSCQACTDLYKGNQFPVVGPRAPQVDVSAEVPLILNPYTDNPRDHIRFNPITSHAYAFDKLSEFFSWYLDIPKNKVGEHLWDHPDLLTIIDDAGAATNKKSDIHAQYQKWNNEQESVRYKGEVSIAVLGLNRPSLVAARRASMLGLYARYVVAENGHPEHDQDIFDALLDREDPTTKGLSAIMYASCSVDSFNSWKRDRAESGICWNTNYRQASPTNSANPRANTMPWFTSSLQYMVLESELSLAGKRRIVCLHSSDFLYGSDRKVKTVFLPIDWDDDFNNVIKVSSPKIVWESSFSELASTQPIALQSLFANNEVWAEGNYASLA
ncbi:hypothetical protein [Arenicella xantha]|uniref:Uncharacterized protein n=1 Tax=Arenicella xantha TaxID=644221 RepID=A0A395JN73_9GAMM|nr:hypothetical protein [Arenicella xantha]RBP53110.1 hypothetical protein DFR28_101495 [Arenicella xantha]